ncbi:hypothetical protein CK203_098792 [Vitis vinifera]|uniref:Ubiquitin-like protease family profile domain-containing protein n=1 Tax=Vitis vinifera TaxID=29760 RepID=A0A438CUR3_VITVI|nr:hypothetical protein CK203_098792 [Vitis vinifera]
MSPPRRDKEQMDGNEGKTEDCFTKKGAFLVDENSKYNIISSIGLALEFQVKSKKGKERRAKYVYIHRVSRKGYAGLQEELMQKTGSRKPIDRWVLWKLARLKKGEYDDVTRPVAEKIAVEEGKITCVGQKDILTLALGTSEHLDGLEEKISIDGTDILVVILYPLQPNALLRFPLSENISTIRKGVGYEVLWHVAFVINDENDEDFGKRKNKMKKIQASPKKIKYENPRDIQLFSKTVLAMLEDLIFLPYNPRFHWVLAVIDLKSQTIYYLDSLLQQPYQDIKDIVNMGFRIFVSQKKKGSKKELKWIVIEIAFIILLRGPNSWMCHVRIFVMRYMRDIIANRSLLISQFEGKKSYSRAELDEVRSEWVSFLSTLILDQV